MPEYTYHCEYCSKTFTVIKPVSKYRPKEKCPHCNKNKHVYRDYQADNMHSTIRLHLSEIKTIGHYAERQTEMKSQDELDHMKYEFSKYKYEKPSRDLPPGMKRIPKPQEKFVFNQDAVRKKRPRKGK